MVLTNSCATIIATPTKHKTFGKNEWSQSNIDQSRRKDSYKILHRILQNITSHYVYKCLNSVVFHSFSRLCYAFVVHDEYLRCYLGELLDVTEQYVGEIKCSLYSLIVISFIVDLYKFTLLVFISSSVFLTAILFFNFLLTVCICLFVFYTLFRSVFLFSYSLY